MEANPMLGVLLHAVGGLAAASFYIPCKRVCGWAWETYWLVLGIVAWLIAPWAVASLKVPNLMEVLRSVPSDVILRCYFYGVLWGIGGLMYGLTKRYLASHWGSRSHWAFVPPSERWPRRLSMSARTNRRRQPA